MNELLPSTIAFDTEIGLCAVRWSEAGITGVLLPRSGRPPGPACEEGAAVPGQVGLACFVVSIGPEAKQLGERLVDELRNAGIPAASMFEDRSLKAQLRLADRSCAAYAVILGEREVSAETAILKSLSDGEQEEVPIGDVVNWLSRTDWAAER